MKFDITQSPPTAEEIERERARAVLRGLWDLGVSTMFAAGLCYSGYLVLGVILNRGGIWEGSGSTLQYGIDVMVTASVVVGLAVACISFSVFAMLNTLSMGCGDRCTRD